MLRTDQLTWTEYVEKLKEEPIVFLPVGAHEQHGPHLPMGTDAILATKMAEAVAAGLQGLVLPTISYGYKSQARSGGGQTFVGTTSLDGQTLIATTQDIVRELARHGVRRLVVLDGHFENQWFLTEGIELAQRELQASGGAMDIVRTEYWDFCPEAVLDTVFEGEFPGYDLEHAALIETSMMLYWQPELVRVDSIPQNDQASFATFDTYPQDGRGGPASGVLAPAKGASGAKGQLIIESTITAITQALGAHFQANS
ncbi:Creatinine amidohydrolase [Halioglobus japonicus]|nr:Creatinine amidohydrolase [Halioglobus japonicus]